MVEAEFGIEGKGAEYAAALNYARELAKAAGVELVSTEQAITWLKLYLAKLDATLNELEEYAKFTRPGRRAGAKTELHE